jgi:DNA repair protein RecO (recombination protein O)
MEWRDEAVVLSARKHGERGVILDALTREHGRHAGLVRYGTSRRLRGVLEPGNQISLRWHARLADQLGQYSVEPVRSRAGILSDPLRLAGLSSACAIALLVLPEREPHGPVYEGLISLLDAIEQVDLWPAVLARWELGVLEELGFGLDLTKCAATGVNEDLIYVSPRSGRAVSRVSGLPYHDRLLPLPAFLLGSQLPAAPADIVAGFDLTGFFLSRFVLEPHGWKMPPARNRLRDRLKNFTSQDAKGDCG